MVYYLKEFEESDLFLCSTLGCKKSFKSTIWLFEHEIKGIHVFAEKKTSMTDRAVAKFNEMIETRESARIAVTEQVESEGNLTNDYGRYHFYIESYGTLRSRVISIIQTIAVHNQEWGLKSSHLSSPLDKTAKEHAETYFHTQRSIIPPRRAEAPYMRKQLEEAMHPTEPNKYLFVYSQVPSIKQLTSLYSTGINQSPKKSLAKTAKVSTTTKTPAKTPNSTRAKSSVRSPRVGTRKRTVMAEPEESEENEAVDEDGEDEEDEILGFHEYDFIKKIIVEDREEIFT